MRVNNGKYRKSTFVIRRMINGNEVFNSVFPVVERINLPFAEVPGITLEELASFSDSEYLNRLSLFYQYIEIKYPFFKLSRYPELSPTGTDLEQCPLDYTMSMSLFANLSIVLTEAGTNKEARVLLHVNQFNGNAASAGQNFTVKLLVKEFFGQDSFVSWDNVDGEVIEISFSPNDSTIEVFDLFRYRGIDDEAKEFKNVFVQILEVEEGSGVEIGEKSIVFTEPSEPFYLVNLISNIQTSVQDFPNQEALDVVVLNGQGIQNGQLTSFFFEFLPNQRMRPVFMYPASYPDLSTIKYMNDGGMDIIDSGAFDLVNGLPKRVTIEGQEFKVYAAKNMVVFTHRAKYEYKF